MNRLPNEVLDRIGALIGPRNRAAMRGMSKRYHHVFSNPAGLHPGLVMQSFADGSDLKTNFAQLALLTADSKREDPRLSMLFTISSRDRHLTQFLGRPSPDSLEVAASMIRTLPPDDYYFVQAAYNVSRRRLGFRTIRFKTSAVDLTVRGLTSELHAAQNTAFEHMQRLLMQKLEDCRNAVMVAVFSDTQFARNNRNQINKIMEMYRHRGTATQLTLEVLPSRNLMRFQMTYEPHAGTLEASLPIRDEHH